MAFYESNIIGLYDFISWKVGIEWDFSFPCTKYTLGILALIVNVVNYLHV